MINRFDLLGVLLSAAAFLPLIAAPLPVGEPARGLLLVANKGDHAISIVDPEAGREIGTVEESGFTALCPFASRFPFETWIMPKTHEADFDAITDDKIKGLARALKLILGKLRVSLKDPAFNFMIHTLPLHGKETDSFHWHIEIIPHLTRVAGFELGTGFYLNPTPPEMAAQALKDTPFLL